MASALPPVRGVAFSFEISLISQADTDTFQDNPTLAAGDVKIIKDGTLDGNIDTLPTAVTSLTRVLTVPLSVDEMTADRVTVLFHDAAGNEWQDAVVTIYTAARRIDDLATPTNITAGTINSVTGSIGGKVLGGGTDTIVGIGALVASGGTLYSYSNTVDDGSGNLLDGVFIQCATDAGFTNIITTTSTNVSGAYTVRSDTAGAHYLRFQLAGFSFADETVILA